MNLLRYPSIYTRIRPEGDPLGRSPRSPSGRDGGATIPIFRIPPAFAGACGGAHHHGAPHASAERTLLQCSNCGGSPRIGVAIMLQLRLQPSDTTQGERVVFTSTRWIHQSPRLGVPQWRCVQVLSFPFLLWLAHSLSVCFPSALRAVPEGTSLLLVGYNRMPDSPIPLFS